MFDEEITEDNLPLVALPKTESGKARLLENWRVSVRDWVFFVPMYFETDGASIPRCLWRVCGHPLQSPRVYAALVHDGLYGNEDWCPSWMTRKEADCIYRDLLVAVGWGKARAYIEYRALRLFGWSHWTKR